MVSLKAGEAVLWVSGKNQDRIGDLKKAHEAESMKQRIEGTGKGKKWGGRNEHL